ncbi:MAG: neuraminidase-like domain-containing protein, partial [Variovorax sp.]
MAKHPVKRSGVKDAKTTIAAKPATAAQMAQPVRSAQPPAAFRITGHVARGDKAGSVGGLRVEAFDQDPNYEQPLGGAHTDERGRYEIRFTAERIGKGETGGPDIIVRVFDRQGAAIVVSPVHRNAAAEVTIDLAIAPKKPASLHDIAAELKLNLAPAFLAGLDKHGIRTLADVRRTGGLRNVQGLAVASADPAVPLLEAHAQLALLPSTPATNAALLKAGYSSLAGIAGVTSRAFIASLSKTMEAGDAEALHAAATAQTRFLEGRITDFRVNAGGRAETKYAALMEKAIPAGCGCEKCKDATSPMAYLADLLDFALRHLKNSGNAVTLTLLQNRFHQPFRDLPATCELMEKRVRQVRICIEVLRQYLPAPQGTSTSPWYLETAYAMLLEKIGTSFDEVRQMRSVADPVKRQAVAARLGIRLHPQRALPNDPDELDRLFLDTDLQTPAQPVWPSKLSEEQLEQLFGLRDTKRPALDPDVTPDILTWRMHYLRSKWHEQDHSAAPLLGETPLIDPDLVGLADLRDTTPAPMPRSARPKATWSALDFLEDRQVWIVTTIGELDQVRRTSDLTQLLAVLQTNVFFLGATGMEGITVPVLLRLLQKKDAGEDIAPLLVPLRLEEDAFDYMSHIVVLERNGDPILDSEWSELYSIIVGRIKKYVQYAVWRDEEARNPQVPDAGITLSPDYFRVRTASFAGGALEWLAQKWRASAAARHKWEDTLRSRTEQEQAVIAGLLEAADATEERVLVQMRDELRISARTVGNINLRTPNALTGYLQIDVQAGGCQTTTRVAQAIETIQGMLFGARNGLLEDDALTLDADHFDEQWQWIGSYATWRAAMQVFLYPENALRPTLRVRRSPAFDALVSNLRKVKGQLTPQAAEREAAAYADYFADVCSLRRVALCQTRSVLQSAREPVDVLALAEGRS